MSYSLIEYTGIDNVDQNIYIRRGDNVDPKKTI
jgi:hypothetical protein